ncbi:MAG TPA: UDP-N-acetylglucosamine 2-epimerase (non-hydrolyzing) [Vicinamibacterales bacterium]|nr:UDP-N-acetylglucosamine 2-epimerase (non-hydrolyzing) [Vicinamibacterales bacterium]HOQ59909.1 UDP-N-acetylglucosamine 2-epimerase (non-hydrolyzing) [Vicinamibacterales bacterium]HPK70450.1 UDP-N-acetylglucosamine 2-epimerase (non-hydrolyzing) [Vicinamibacterales bacterium]
MGARSAPVQVHLVCGARPNFMKVAPLYHALAAEPWADPVIVHTGQHYDANMSGAFFADFGLPEPHVSLGVGSGTHAEQTAKVMVAYERVLQERRPDLVVVVGDVNSTAAATLAAAKLGVKVAHLEAGLRSRDRRMPEELNRLVTDVLADLLWAPSQDGVENLLAEGIPAGRIQLVGNIMIDTLEMCRERIERQDAFSAFGLRPGGFAVATIHRPSNVDDPAVLGPLCAILESVSELVPLVFPVHPRTGRRIAAEGLLAGARRAGRLFLPEPMPYIAFMNLVFNARLVITDSGGIQEETTYLGIPCLTMRENTERPITVTQGTNRLCAPDRLLASVREILRRRPPSAPRIPYWDGRTAGRVVEAIRGQFAWRAGAATAEAAPLAVPRS